VEGAGIGGGAIIFENETILEFSRQFLSVSISTNKAIYTGYQTVRVLSVNNDKIIKVTVVNKDRFYI
jgi:hypothetical protein